MSLHKATFTVTADSQGPAFVGASPLLARGSADVHLTNGVGSRHAQLVGVAVDISAAQSTDVDVTLTELITATLPSGVTSAESYEYGRQLFYADLRNPAGANMQDNFRGVYRFDARRPVVGTDGTVPTTDFLDSRPIITQSYVRCEVYKCAAADVVTVTMYYETSGDYRF